MAQLGNVNIDGLDLSGGMRNDLANGMSVGEFNSKYSASVPGFRPISSSRQLSAPAPAAPPPQQAPAPAPGPDPAAQERQRLEAEVNGLFAEGGNLYNSMQNPVDVYNKAMESLGLADARTRVVGLREQLMNTESLLRNVEGSVQGRIQDSNVTESQRQRLVATEQQPLSGQVDIYGRALEGAMQDYGMIQQEGKTQAELTFQGEQAKRQALMDRLQTAISRSNSAEDKRRWEIELQRLKDQDAEAKRQFDLKLAQQQAEFNANMTLENQKFAASRASGGGSGGGGGGGGGSSGSSVDPMKDFLGYISSQFKAAGKDPSRQSQDAWANAWFSQHGVSTAARQVYWDAFNKTYNRPANPYQDRLYKK